MTLLISQTRVSTCFAFVAAAVVAVSAEFGKATATADQDLLHALKVYRHSTWSIDHRVTGSRSCGGGWSQERP